MLPAGTRRLSGKEALWYGRSRSDGDDYVRMSRQKCLLYAVAQQADPDGRAARLRTHSRAPPNA